MPDDLASQMPYIKRLCEAYNVPMISVPGFEADDVIGALAMQAAGQGLQSVIVSNDKDMCQLVRDPLIVCMRQNSQVIKRKEPVPQIEWCDEAWVEKKFGVTAAQVVDLLGLMGDSVDNIPGAPGIGSKGAVQLIQTYGSIENALEHWEDVKHKTYRESLRNNAELIRKSRELARIRIDVDVHLDLNELERRPPDRAAAYDLFRELEFTALTNEFADGAVAAAKVEGERTYSMVRNQAELDALIQQLWQAEHIGLAVSNSSPPRARQQQRMHDSHAHGIALAPHAGSSALGDFGNFAVGKNAALHAMRALLRHGLTQ